MCEHKTCGQNEQNLTLSDKSSVVVQKNELLEPYRPHIDNFDLTTEQKLELIGVIRQMADIILDTRFALIKQPHNSNKLLDNNSASSDGVRHGN